MRWMKLDARGVSPERAHPSDAGADLRCLDDFSIRPLEVVKVGTGIAVDIVSGFMGRILGKSGLGARGITVFGGVIDAGYTGEVIVLLGNAGKEPVTFVAGSKIAQLVVTRIELSSFEEVASFESTTRGAGGFGSTGQ